MGRLVAGLLHGVVLGGTWLRKRSNVAWEEVERGIRLHLHGVGISIKAFASIGAWLGVAWERGGAWRQGLPLYGVGFGGVWLDVRAFVCMGWGIAAGFCMGWTGFGRVGI